MIFGGKLMIFMSQSEKAIRVTDLYPFVQPQLIKYYNGLVRVAIPTIVTVSPLFII